MTKQNQKIKNVALKLNTTSNEQELYKEFKTKLKEVREQNTFSILATSDEQIQVLTLIKELFNLYVQLEGPEQITEYLTRNLTKIIETIKTKLNKEV